MSDFLQKLFSLEGRVAVVIGGKVLEPDAPLAEVILTTSHRRLKAAAVHGGKEEQTSGDQKGRHGPQVP